MSDDEQQQQQQAAGVAAAALSLATTELEYRVELLNRCDAMMLTVQVHHSGTAYTRPACFACWNHAGWSARATTAVQRDRECM